MNLKEIVCSLELSKKLRELGVKQESLYYWVNSKYTINNVHTLMYVNDTYIKWPEPDFYFSAFTASELLEMLPAYINNWQLRITKFVNLYDVDYIHDTYFLCEIVNDSVSDGLAKTLIYLIENNYIKAVDL